MLTASERLQPNSYQKGNRNTAKLSMLIRMPALSTAQTNTKRDAHRQSDGRRLNGTFAISCPSAIIYHTQHLPTGSQPLGAHVKGLVPN